MIFNEIKIIIVTFKTIPLFILKCMMIYHSGGNLTLAGCVSPVMSLIMIIKALFSFNDRDFNHPSIMSLLRLGLYILVLFLFLFYNMNFSKVDTRPGWAQDLAYNKFDGTIALFLKIKDWFMGISAATGKDLVIKATKNITSDLAGALKTDI